MLGKVYGPYNNPNNNDLSNLRIIDASIHQRDDHPTKFVELKCFACGIIFSKELRKLNVTIGQNKRGPYCSKACKDMGSLKITKICRKDKIKVWSNLELYREKVVWGDIFQEKFRSD